MRTMPGIKRLARRRQLRGRNCSPSRRGCLHCGRHERVHQGWRCDAERGGNYDECRKVSKNFHGCSCKIIPGAFKRDSPARGRLCERSEAIQKSQTAPSGLLRCARNDENCRGKGHRQGPPGIRGRQCGGPAVLDRAYWAARANTQSEPPAGILARPGSPETAT